MPELLILGNRSMDTVRRPLCGCFVLSCMVGGIFRKPLGFRRCLPPARPEKAKPFQAGRSPCTKHPRLSSFAFTLRKKFLRVPRGVFSKTLIGRAWDRVPQRESKPIWRGAPFQAGQGFCTKRPQTVRLGLHTPKKFLRVPRGVFSKTLLGREWDRVPQKESEPAHRGTPFQAGQSLCTKHPRLSGLDFTHSKKFLRVPRGVFSKTLIGREWDRVPKREKSSLARQGTPFQAGQSPFTKRPHPVRLGLHEPKKVFEGSKGRFFKNAPWKGVGQGPTKREQASHRGTPFQAGRSPFTKRPQTVRLGLYAPKKF